MLFASLLFALAAEIAPGEIPIADPGVAVSTRWEDSSAIASHGDGYLLVWSGDRGLLASRLDLDGMMLDLDPIVIDETPRLVTPRVVFIGSSYLVTYADRFALVTTDGVVLRSGILPFPADAEGVENPVASNGRNVIVAYGLSSFAIYDANLRVVRAAMLRAPGTFAVVGTDKGFAAFRSIGRATLGTSIADDGTVIASDVAIAETSLIAAVSSGHRIAVASDSSATIVDSDLRVVSTQTLLPPLFASAFAYIPPQVERFELHLAASQHGFLLASLDTYNGAGAARVRRLDESGTPLDAFPVFVSPFTIASGLNVASNGVSYLLAWNDQSSTSLGNVWGAYVSLSGASREMPLVLGPASQTMPAAAFNDRGGLVAWHEETAGPNYPRGAGHRLLAARVGADGVVLDKTPIEIDNAKPLAVATNGRDFLIVWSSTELLQTLSATVVPADGSAPTTSTISTAAEYDRPASVASDGDGYFVLWWGNRLRGSHVSRDGRVVDVPPFEYSYLVSPAITFDGTGYWLLFDDGSARARRISREGFFDGTSVPLGENHRGAAIACRNGRCAAFGCSSDSLTATVFDEKGLIVTTTALPVSDCSALNAVADDAGFVVTWRKADKYHYDTAFAVSISRNGDLPTAGAIVTPLLLPATLLPEGVWPVSVKGRRVIVYARGVESNRSRVFLRFLDSESRRRAAGSP